MSTGGVALSALFGFLFLFVLLRLSGKRTIGEATPLHFVLAIMLGETFDDLVWGKVPAAQFMVASGTLLLLHVMLELMAARNEFIHWLTMGQSQPMLRDGRPVREGLRSEFINSHDLEHILREHGVDPENAMDDVELCEMEEHGRASVLKRPSARAAQRQDGRNLRPA